MHSKQRYQIIIFFFLTISLLHVQGQSGYVKDFNLGPLLEVHSPDDFFDRFNFRAGSSFRVYLERKYPMEQLTRREILRNLFDLKQPALKTDTTLNFIKWASDTAKPVYIKGGSVEWYAHLTCLVSYHQQKSKLQLYLRIMRHPNGGMSWNVVSAYAPFLSFNKTKSDSLLLSTMKPFDPVTSKKYFLSPVSHGIDFMNINEFFEAGTNSRFYIFPGHRSFEIEKLLSLINKSEIRFLDMENIRYHMLQLEGWILVLELVQRSDGNSGWLIRKLMAADTQRKRDYKKFNLGIPYS